MMMFLMIHLNPIYICMCKIYGNYAVNYCTFYMHTSTHFEVKIDNQ